MSNIDPLNKLSPKKNNLKKRIKLRENKKKEIREKESV